jgi:uncharacterized protein YggE
MFSGETSMTFRLIPLAALAGVAVTPAAASAAEVQIAATGPVVELTVTENETGSPDLATLDAGVTTVAPTAVQAMADNAAQMTRVVDRIRALGIDREDIQTSGISLNPEYEWDEATRSQRFRGYRVTNRVSVKLRRIEKTGEVLDALVAAGATDLGGINWSIDDPAPAQDRARVQAMRTAEARAMDYARMAGFSGVRLLEVSETMQQRFYPEAITVTAQARDASAPATPVVPGQVQTGVTVSVKYEMTR